ncbi:MAG: murein hydrolase activator EnvC family protein [Eubacteriaceae bacterium]|jgi:murein DD-endopeptidase MepM/ murein hydrolase activator NlpD
MNKRIISILTVLLLVFSIYLPVFAEDSSTDLSSQQAKVTELQQKVNDANAKVEDYNKQIADKEAQITATQAQLDQAEADRAQQEAELKERMRAMYMYGNDGYLEMMFSADNLTDMMTYYDLSKEIMDADKTAQNQLINTKKVISDSKQKLEDDKAAIEAARAESEAVQADLAKQLAENKDLVEQLEKTGSSSSGSTTTTTVAGGAAGSLASSGWTWPIDASASNAFLITSLMGTRESPGGVGSTDHGGTDIAAEYGAKIVAAQSGEVVQAGTYGGYGNCVTINTTDGYVTMYGHMSAIAASVGQTVNAGDVIGYEGSTGWSTGAHLHFEVRDGAGNKLNGLQFYGSDILSKLTYSLDA